VRYSPNGSHFASAGFDGKVFLYDGSSADLVGEIGSPAHKGGVYAVSIQHHTLQQHVSFTVSYRNWVSRVGIVTRLEAKFLLGAGDFFLFAKAE
jgi:WD40 repeat protein